MPRGMITAPELLLGCLWDRSSGPGGETRFRTWIWGWDKTLIAVSQAWCSWTISPSLGRIMWEDHESKASSGYKRRVWVGSELAQNVKGTWYRLTRVPSLGSTQWDKRDTSDPHMHTMAHAHTNTKIKIKFKNTHRNLHPTTETLAHPCNGWCNRAYCCSVHNSQEMEVT